MLGRFIRTYAKFHLFFFMFIKSTAKESFSVILPILPNSMSNQPFLLYSKNHSLGLVKVGYNHLLNMRVLIDNYIRFCAT